MGADGRIDWRWVAAGKRAQVGPLADWCKTIGQNQECIKQAAKAYSYFAGNKASSRFPRWFFSTKTSSTKRRILNVLPCWGPMQKGSRDSFRSACANRATQIDCIVKQNKWQSGAMQRHGRLFLSLVPIQAFSGCTRRGTWTATLHARHVQASENLRKKEGPGSTRNMEDSSTSLNL